MEDWAKTKQEGVTMAGWMPDPSFYLSPRMAMQASVETPA